MKITLLMGFLALLTLKNYAQTTLFQQDFSSSTAVSGYISSTPGTDKFNGINGPSGSAAIVNGTLQFSRLTDGTTGHFSHTTDFSPVPTSLYIQFDFEVVSATTVAGTSCLVFYVGNSFSNGVGNPSNADTYARFGINFTGNGYDFSVRSIPNGGGGSNSAIFSGKQRLTFVLNNTGSTIIYLQPGGGTKTLLNDTYDLWIGTTRVFTELPVLTVGQTMTDFKLRIDDDPYAAVFQFDNFLIRDINGVLPIATTDFRAIVTNSAVNLTWQLAQQSTNLFSIERSIDALTFSPIGSIQQTENPDKQRTYNFTDHSPAGGINYYRLRQTSADGNTTVSKIVAVEVPTHVQSLTVLDNPTEGSTISMQSQNMTGATYLLTTLTGQLIPCAKRETPDGQVALLPQHPLPSGVYLITASTGAIRLTQRLVVR